MNHLMKVTRELNHLYKMTQTKQQNKHVFCLAASYVDAKPKDRAVPLHKKSADLDKRQEKIKA